MTTDKVDRNCWEFVTALEKEESKIERSKEKGVTGALGHSLNMSPAFSILKFGLRTCLVKGFLRVVAVCDKKLLPSWIKCGMENGALNSECCF
ncbi:hypothetical protein L484_020439 [Morus notabilis]|uniref:Uncharacterized protein n=1 Tax=Morus notabilis TaxID=981085 RepID=W9SLT2_9ROSA|nr:hypothetical protein L484_020439 [Morus notabilis]